MFKKISLRNKKEFISFITAIKFKYTICPENIRLSPLLNL